MKKLLTVGGGTPPSHTLPPLGRYAPSGLVASLPRKDCAPPNVLAHYATEPGGTYAHPPSPEPRPYLREKDIQGYTPLSRVLVTVGNYKKHPLFLVFSEIFPRLRPKNTHLSRENGNTHVAPLCIRVGGPGTDPTRIFQGSVTYANTLIFLPYGSPLGGGGVLPVCILGMCRARDPHFQP